MSELTLNHTARLTDALGATCSAAPSKPTQRPPAAEPEEGRQAVVAGIAAVFAFIDEVNESMNRARAASSRFSGSQW